MEAPIEHKKHLAYKFYFSEVGKKNLEWMLVESQSSIQIDSQTSIESSIQIDNQSNIQATYQSGDQVSSQSGKSFISRFRNLFRRNN